MKLCFAKESVSIYENKSNKFKPQIEEPSDKVLYLLLTVLFPLVV